jgi:hypothetical protein
MKKMITFLAVLPLAAVSMFASTSVSNAELVKTGDFIYDTVQDLTFYDVNPGNMNWSDAKAWALRLVAGGVDDWRLPADSVEGEWSSGNGNELATVTNVGSFDGNVPFTHTQFITLDGFPFWSSVYGRGNNHLQIGNDDGFVNDDNPDTDLRGVIAVRSGAIPVATSNAIPVATSNTILAATSAMAAPKLPKGFIVYSRGRGGNRTLHMVKLAPGMTEEQVRSSEQLICAKGDKSGDIQGQISFDGKMLAFARGVDANEHDYHKFDRWDVYVVRLDGELPAKPIRVDHGYWPSWGVDSTGPTKTLYFSKHKDKVGTIHKATIAPDGTASSITKCADLPRNRYEGFAMASPDGTFAAARYGGGVSAVHFGGKLKGRTIRIGGGCMPHVTADSQWVYNAIRNVARADGKAKGNPEGGGQYHYGSSVDMKWFVTKSTGGVYQQNDGGKVILCALTATETTFELEPGMTVSDDGSWLDVHTDGQ